MESVIVIVTANVVFNVVGVGVGVGVGVALVLVTAAAVVAVVAVAAATSDFFFCRRHAILFSLRFYVWFFRSVRCQDPSRSKKRSRGLHAKGLAAFLYLQSAWLWTRSMFLPPPLVISFLVSAFVSISLHLLSVPSFLLPLALPITFPLPPPSLPPPPPSPPPPFFFLAFSCLNAPPNIELRQSNKQFYALDTASLSF